MTNTNPHLDLDVKCICIELRHAAQAVTKLYDEQLLPCGLTVTQLSQLNHIRQLDEPTLKALADVTGLDRSTLGRNMRLMEKEGLVSLSPGADARTRVITITGKGKKALQQGAPLWLDIQTRLTRKLGPDKRAQLNTLLNELTA